MIIFNMSLNKKKIAKTILWILLTIILILIIICFYKVFFYKDKKDPCINTNKVEEIQASNYTKILKDIHENIDHYIGKKIRFTGFVYRLDDFNDNQFVLAREMIISADYQAVIVGFLCELNNAKQYKDGCWIEVEGTVTKGEYHGEIPIIKIEKIKEVKCPNEEYVYPSKAGV